MARPLSLVLDDGADASPPPLLCESPAGGLCLSFASSQMAAAAVWSPSSSSSSSSSTFLPPSLFPLPSDVLCSLPCTADAELSWLDDADAGLRVGLLCADGCDSAGSGVGSGSGSEGCDDSLCTAGVDAGDFGCGDSIAWRAPQSPTSSPSESASLSFPSSPEDDCASSASASSSAACSPPARTPFSAPTRRAADQKRRTAASPRARATAAASGARKRRLTATAPPADASTTSTSLSAPSSPRSPLSSPASACEGEGGDKRERNKQSASDYRKRRKLYVASLEQRLHSAVTQLSDAHSTVKKLSAENDVLRHSMHVLARIVHRRSNTSLSDDDHDDSHDDDHALLPAVARAPPAVGDATCDEAAVEDAQFCAAASRPSRTRTRTRSASARRQALGVSVMAVLFSCFLLYLPWLTQLDGQSALSSAASQAWSMHALHPLSPSPLWPDCAASPAACNRGRALLALHVDAAYDERAAQPAVGLSACDGNGAGHAPAVLNVTAAVHATLLSEPFSHVNANPPLHDSVEAEGGTVWSTTGMYRYAPSL